MPDYIYPGNADLDEIAQDKLPALIATRPIFNIMPMDTEDNTILMWEQKDNYIGLQQVRGINADARRVNPIGLKRYMMEPGVYGEFLPIDEREMLNRRVPGTFGTPINVEDLVMEKQDQLLQRRLDRIEYIGWTLLVTGTFAVSDGFNTIHTDTFSIQTYSAGTTWATFSSSTPLADLRAVQLLHRGHSVSFGAESVAYLNQVTFNNLLSNGNAADLYGRRTSGFGTVNSPGALNQLLTGDNLPTFQVYDEGYFNDSGTFVPFIANGKIVIVGKRPAGQVIAKYLMTRNVNNPGLAPGAYQKVMDFADSKVPRSLEVHDGHNGGPVIYFPSAIVVMSV